MMRFSRTVMLSALIGTLLVSCGIMNETKNERVPVPPPGTTERMKPWNETQRFEGEAALGPLASPRR